MSTLNLSGVGVALVTPFQKDKSVDYKALEALVENTINNGVKSLLALGTTSEAVTLTQEEKHLVVQCIKKANNARVPLIVGIGGNCTQAVVDSIKNFDFEGIDAILSVAPYYNKPEQRGMYLHFKAIAEASPVPVILYNVPGRTSSNISAQTTIQLATEFKNIIGIKEASGDFNQISQILKNRPEGFQVLSGDDGTTLPHIATGGDGVISVIANAFPAEFSEMVNLALNNNMKAAQSIHYRLIDIIDALFVEGNPAGVKAFMNCNKQCENELRLPLIEVSDSTYEKIKILNDQL